MYFSLSTQTNRCLSPPPKQAFRPREIPACFFSGQPVTPRNIKPWMKNFARLGEDPIWDQGLFRIHLGDLREKIRLNYDSNMGNQNLVKLPLGFDGKGLVVSKKKIRNLEFLLPSKEVLVTGSVKAAGKQGIVAGGE